jgi:23S rRNA (guanine745-N1)-methyltransferase
MKKLDLMLSQISSRPGLLACPLCRGALAPEGSALRCPSGHCFDIASSGYVNLLTRRVKSDYGAEMLEARRRVCAAGFFDALLVEAVNLIVEHTAAGMKRELAILDAGCGEGSHLARISGLLKGKTAFAATGIGIDISKDGIHIAAREHPGLLWLVGDLTRLPLADGSVDILLNILSPSNYAEFSRVLKPGGLLVKAVPGEGYLRELRQALGERAGHSGEKVEGLFERCFVVTERRRIQQSFRVPPELWPDIVAMTPLAWGKDDETVRSAVMNPSGTVTLDFPVLAGRKPMKGE